MNAAMHVRPPDGNTDFKGHSLTCLLVDDEENVLRALKRLLNDESYRVLTAQSGDEALEILDKESVQLVISDQQMPGMTGIDLLKTVNRKWPDVIRIMLTGHGNIDTVMAAVNEGAVYKFITKPWNNEDLLVTVRLALRQYCLIEENRKLRQLTSEQEKKLTEYAGVLDENKGILGSYLLRVGKLGRQQLDEAFARRRAGELLGDTLQRLDYVSEEDIITAFEKNLRLQCLDLSQTHIDAATAKFLPKDLCERNRILPVRLTKKEIHLAMADPSDMFKCDNIAMMTSLQVVPFLARSSEILQVLQTLYGDGAESISETSASQKSGSLDDFEDEIDILLDEQSEAINIPQLLQAAEVPPIIRVVNAIFAEGLRLKASDIHIEPKSEATVVRYRTDGLLVDRMHLPTDLHAALVSRVKILASLDISERRTPQDGRLTLKTKNKLIDVRVSSMPTINGEKIVLRVLDKGAAILPLSALGLCRDEEDQALYLLNKPQGMIISTGPTGSGKTTLLYSMLNSVLSGQKNYQTIEDPVEYFLDGANQIFVHERAGLSFPSVLRATLRQDPDVILVGEIRDGETADIAFKAALTGHLVLSSLHTNASVSSITRLIDMGIKPYLIASALTGIIAQRLVRTLCSHCKTPADPNPDVLRFLGLISQARSAGFYGAGCKKCHESGYKGRTGIFEFFVMNDEFRHFISGSYKETELEKMARAGGMIPLIENGLRKVEAGITSYDELLRVIGAQSSLEKACGSCGNLVDPSFPFCPYCGVRKANYCLQCRQVLEDAWRVCPSCGAPKQDNRSSGSEFPSKAV